VKTTVSTATGSEPWDPACIAAVRAEFQPDLVVTLGDLENGSLIAGGEADERTQQQFAAQVEAHSLAPHFFWRPTLAPQEMPTFYGLVASTRGLLLSTPHEEAFGLTLLEAMASGVPVVAPAVGGIPEVVRAGDTGTLLPPNASVGAWIQALEALLDDEAWYERRAARGRTWVAERFDIRAGSRLASYSDASSWKGYGGGKEPAPGELRSFFNLPPPLGPARPA